MPTPTSPLRRFLALLGLLLALGSGSLSRAQEAGASARAAAEPSDLPTPVVQRWRIGHLHVPFAIHRATDRLLTVERGGAILWDTRSGLAVRSFPSDVRESQLVSALAFSPDGSRVLIGNEAILALYDSASSAAVVDFDSEGYALHDAALSPDGRFVAAACADAAVRIWDARTGQLQRTLREHRYTVEYVRFSPDSTQLLSGGNDSLAVLWDVASGRVVHRLASPTEVRGAAFSSDGKRLLTHGSGEFWHTVRVVVWDRASGLPLQTIGRPFSAAWFAGDEVALLQHDGERIRWAADRHEPALEPDAFPTSSEPVVFLTQLSQDHWTLRSHRERLTAELISPEGEVFRLPASTSAARPAADSLVPLDITADGRWLLTGGGYGSEERNCVVWDLHEARLHRVLVPGSLARFTPDGTRIAISRYQTLTLFDRDSGETLQKLEVDRGAFESLQFVGEGKQLLTASGDWYDGNEGQLLLWDVASGRQLRSYAPSDKAVTHAHATTQADMGPPAPNASEQQIVAFFTPGYDGSAGIDQVSVFDLHSGKRTADLALPHFHYGAPLLDPKGKFFVLEHWRHEVISRDLVTLEPRHRFPPHLVGLSSDGQILATYANHEQLNLWNTESGKFLAAHPIPFGHLRNSLFHPGGWLFFAQTTRSAASESLLGGSVGCWDLLDGELEAELFTFDNGSEWLIHTAAGHFAGSAGGLRRVAWRSPEGNAVALDPPRTEARTQPRQVAKVFSLGLPDGASLFDALADRAPAEQTPPTSSSGPVMNEVKRGDPHQTSLHQRRTAIQAFEEAGTEVEANIHGYIESIHMEGLPLTTELAERLPWVRSTERLYLAATGVTDAQLEWVGMMGNVRRLSLWGTPISDRGLAELATLWDLEVLDVHDTQVTAAGLNQLWLLPKLKKVIVPAAINPTDLAPLERLREVEIVPR